MAAFLAPLLAALLQAPARAAAPEGRTLLERHFGAGAPAAAPSPQPPASAPVGPAAGEGEKTYLEPKSLALVSQFPAPPAAGSAVEREDFRVLHEWQNARTAAQCGAAAAQESPFFGSFFGGASPLPDPLPAGAAVFFARVGAEAGVVDHLIKRRFRRPRPFLADPTLAPCIARPGGYAYPSGHAAVSRLYALILSELAPRRRAEFLARADQAALNRVIGGVHHPSDVEAGRRLADGLFAELMRSREFLEDLEKLRGRVVRP